jgi:hypothetical protein
VPKLTLANDGMFVTTNEYKLKLRHNGAANVLTVGTPLETTPCATLWYWYVYSTHTPNVAVVAELGVTAGNVTFTEPNDGLHMLLPTL